MITDLNYLKKHSGVDESMIPELIKIFITQVAELGNDMDDVYKSGDYIKLGNLFHKAKGTVLVMGMVELADLLKRSEINAKQNIETDSYLSIIERFKNDCSQAIIELEEQLNI